MKRALILGTCVTVVNAFSAIRSMSVIGNSFVDATKMFCVSLSGPFTGWLIQSVQLQWLASLITIMLVAPVFRWKGVWATLLAGVGIALWLLPNAAVMWTGI
jgi:hypothetical protein